MPDAVSRFFKKYATFSGRASRSEYWWWVLANGIVLILFYAAAILSALNEPEVGLMIVQGLASTWLLATLVPAWALIARRLHDVNVSGWLALLVLIPFFGAIVIIVFAVMDAKPEGQRFDQPEHQRFDQPVSFQD
ncbi:DUF805 domain-containing protein [Arthrobacter sp. HMWF013]|uniref:DUF805 domain-containing protein n=1 Tax=Arthrobacter sp. HMWF013 TaxID=2056849 RepID=UPI002159E272|nr:DUF805 domain-containing protein [Arthrobacter sp. HMWF013]